MTPDQIEQARAARADRARDDQPQRLPRPTPKTPFTVFVRNRRILSDWETLLRTRRSACLACWDHIANTPTQPVGKRYEPLKGDQAYAEFRGQRLRQWQWEIDRGARVKVAVASDFVVVMGVWTGHPKENE